MNIISLRTYPGFPPPPIFFYLIKRSEDPNLIVHYPLFCTSCCSTSLTFKLFHDIHSVLFYFLRAIAQISHLYKAAVKVQVFFSQFFTFHTVFHISHSFSHFTQFFTFHTIFHISHSFSHFTQFSSI